MKSLTMLLMTAFSIFTLAAFAQDSAEHPSKHPGQKKATIYRCPMHPDVTSEKPGKCPKCGSIMGLSHKERMKMDVMKTYTCPMHPGETSDKPGKCPKCGMELKKTAKTVQGYSCPDHPEITSDKPGTCSKCGKELMPGQSLKEKMKMEVMKTYTCPMHPDVTSDKPGKCPKCGMEMKEKKKDGKS